MQVNELFDLSGRVAIVSGGSRGLGLQLAEALAEQGAKLVLTARKAAQLDQAMAQLTSTEVLTLAANLADEGVAAQIVEQTLAHFGRIDVLVNNAGTTWGAPAEDYPLEAWHKVLNLNVTGAWLLSQQVAKAAFIPQQHGRIINIASVAGLQGNQPPMMGTIAYNTSKGALITMTKALAAEWAKYKITVNAIAPGYFPTKMTKGTLEYAEESIKQATPLGRLGSAHDLKGLAVLLASDASAYITGQIVAVDGGISII